MLSRPALAAIPLVLLALLLAFCGRAGRSKNVGQFAAPIVGAVREPAPPTELSPKPKKQAEPDAANENGGGATSPAFGSGRSRNTLFWQPQLIADASGRAQLEIPLTDYVTTWRITITAVSRRGELGFAQIPLRVVRPSP
jgi:hypothetical protein